MAAPQDPPAESEATTEAAPETQGTEQGTTTAQPEGLDAIKARMDEMASQQAQLVEMLQFDPGETEEEEPDESLLYDEEGQLTDEGARQMIADLVAEQVQQQLAPREQAAAVRERDSAFDDLRETYPGLQDEKVAAQCINQALGWANENAPNLIDSPAFVDLVEQIYVGMKYRERADAEQPVTPGRGVVLESAGGAAPATDKQVDWGDRIVKAAERLRPQL